MKRALKVIGIVLVGTAAVAGVTFLTALGLYLANCGGSHNLVC